MSFKASEFEQHLKLLAPGQPDLLLFLLGHIPDLGLVRADGVLAGLVIELVVGLVRFAFIRLGLIQVSVHLVTQVVRQPIEQHVLEIGRQVDLGRFGADELAEGLLRQSRGAVLDRSTQVVAIPGDPAEMQQGVEIDRNLLDRAVRQHDPAVGGAGLDADLAHADRPSGDLVQVSQVAVHVSPQLFFGGVLPTDFADFAADRDGHAGRLQRANVGREHGRELAVERLLSRDGGLVQVNQGGGVDIDVEKPGPDRFPAQVAYRLELGLRLAGVAGGRNLEVVALDEHRAAVAFGDGGRQDIGGVLARPLVGVAHLGAGDFEDKRSGVDGVGGVKHRPGGIEGQRPQVDRRDREGGRDFSPAAPQVQLVDRSRHAVQGQGRHPDDEAGQPLAGTPFQGGDLRQAVDGGPQPVLVPDLGPAVVQGQAVVQQRQ